MIALLAVIEILIYVADRRASNSSSKQ
jgi:hypothetical protein